MSRAQLNLIGFGLLLLGVTGCGAAAKGGVVENNLVKVAGTVLIDGKPVEGVIVGFVPAGTNGTAHQALAVTDSDGRFDMQNFQMRPGLPAGEYAVLMTYWAKPNGERAPDDVPPADVMASQVIPPYWSDISKAGRHNTVTVAKEGVTDMSFNVKMRQLASR